MFFFMPCCSLSLDRGLALVFRVSGLQAGDGGGDLADQGEQLGPGRQFAGERDDLAPQLVLGEPLRGRFRRPVCYGLRR
jgi:hypothetical protein